ncbi:MAG: serine/threonine protein kinase [Chromatiales bacterium]|nr:serine/threonine protein kinase [Chromatiales bacterium]
MTDQTNYRELGPAQILDAVDSLGLRSDGRLLPLNSYENRVYRVGIEEGQPIVVKFYRPGRWSDEAILEEHAFAAELAGDELPVVAPLAHEGRTLHHAQGFRFAVSPCRGGHAPELDRSELLLQLGRLVARIHLHGARRQRFRHRPRLSLETHGRIPARFLLEREFIPAELSRVYSGLCGHLFQLVGACLDRAGTSREICLHGDFHPGNVLVDGERLHIVDLDDSMSGPAIQDLWMFLSGGRSEQIPQLAALLAGYTEFRAFDARELHLVEALRTLRMIHYAAWLARRHEEPAFKQAFPWFNTPRYWDEHILALREQASLMEEPPLPWQA